MKTRNGFVSNSSSSSFVIITAGDTTILEDGNSEDMETCGSVDMDIDKLIAELEAAKKKGITSITISHGGGYEG